MIDTPMDPPESKVDASTSVASLDEDCIDDGAGDSNNSFDKKLYSCLSADPSFELFILSEAGKPIYSYTRREDIITLMPVCQALMSVARSSQEDTLHSIITSSKIKINFATRSPLIIIVINKIHSNVDPKAIVGQVEAQIASVLTLKSLKNLFEERPTFDLRRVLMGSEKLIDSTINLSILVSTKCTRLQGFLCGAKTVNKCNKILVPVESMPSYRRDQIHKIIGSFKSTTIVFTLLFRLTDDGIFELVTISNHHTAHKISPLDVHLLLALLNGSKNQLMSVESLWMPVCLPRFNSNAFLHSHISFLKNSFCLVILTVDRNEFSGCQTIRTSIEDKLIELSNKLEPKSCSDSTVSDLSSLPLNQLQFLWYQTQRQVLTLQQSPNWNLSPLVDFVARRMSQSQLKTLWLKTENDKVILGWNVSTFQLYTQFDATISTAQALEAVHLITNWIKKEEDNFVLKDYK